MQLSELFVSHKQVDPVSFEKDEPDVSLPLYYNRTRAQKVVTPEVSTEPEETSEDLTAWKVPKLDNTPDWSVRTTETFASTPSAKLGSYRKSAGYNQFKSELDKFIEKNPNYASIKDSLDYLAALESSYNLGVTNGRGSGALGWFQFLDNTRSMYNNQSRADFAKDPQAQLMTAAKHYTNLQNSVRKKGGDPNDFVTMYGAWWRPQSAYAYIKDNTYDYKTKYGESFSGIRKRAQELFG
jgi:hypothetical protein